MAKKTDVSVIVMVLVIVAVAVLGGFAVAPKIGEYMATKESQQLSERVSNGTATVDDLANSSGMKFDEFIARYGLKAEDVSADTSMTELMEKLTLKNYCAFMGLTYTDEDLEAYKATLTEEDKEITADTTDMEAKNGFVQYLYTKQEAAAAAAAPEAAPEAEAEPETETTDAE